MMWAGVNTCLQCMIWIETPSMGIAVRLVSKGANRFAVFFLGSSIDFVVVIVGSKYYCWDYVHLGYLGYHCCSKSWYCSTYYYYGCYVLLLWLLFQLLLLLEFQLTCLLLLFQIWLFFMFQLRGLLLF